MKRILNYAAIAVGLWVLASFAGTMIDKANGELWTQSLMVSLIASLLVLPAALILAVRDSDKQAAEAQQEQQEFDTEKFSKEAFGDEGPQKKEAPATVALNVDDIEKHAEEMKANSGNNGSASADAGSDNDTLWPDDEEEPQNA